MVSTPLACADQPFLNEYWHLNEIHTLTKGIPIAHWMQGFIQNFLVEGEIIACGNIPKLGGSRAMLPQENFEIYDL